MDRISASQRREELKEYLDSVGVLNLNKSELGRKYGVSDVVIGKDLKLILSDTKPSDVSLILRRFDSAFQLALDRALKSLSTASGSRETNDSIRSLIVVIHEYLSSLSKLGYPVSNDDSPPPKPSIQQFITFLESPFYAELKQKREKITPNYSNIDYKPSSPNPPIQMSPQPQESILDDLEEDDLVPYSPDKENEEENNA